MFLGFSARVRAEPRAAGACFPISVCPWEMLLGFSARVRAEPRAAVACFPLPGCPWEVIPETGLGFSASSRQSPELLVLVLPFLLVLGQAGSCVMLCFPSRVHTRNPLGSLELGQSWALEFLHSGCGFALFQGLKIAGVFKSFRTSLSEQSFSSLEFSSSHQLLPPVQPVVTLVIVK